MTHLVQWTIYKNPRDYPNKFVLRACVIGPRGVQPVEGVCVVDTLDEARARVPEGLVRLPRFANDDPVIVEVWT